MKNPETPTTHNTGTLFGPVGLKVSVSVSGSSSEQNDPTSSLSKPQKWEVRTLLLLLFVLH